VLGLAGSGEEHSSFPPQCECGQRTRTNGRTKERNKRRSASFRSFIVPFFFLPPSAASQLYTKSSRSPHAPQNAPPPHNPSANQPTNQPIGRSVARRSRGLGEALPLLLLLHPLDGLGLFRGEEVVPGLVCVGSCCVVWCCGLERGWFGVINGSGGWSMCCKRASHRGGGDRYGLLGVGVVVVCMRWACAHTYTHTYISWQRRARRPRPAGRPCRPAPVVIMVVVVSVMDGWMDDGWSGSTADGHTTMKMMMTCCGVFWSKGAYPHSNQSNSHDRARTLVPSPPGTRLIRLHSTMVAPSLLARGG
jgi:hypothetical protein